MAFPSRRCRHHPAYISNWRTHSLSRLFGYVHPEIWSGKLIEKFYASTVLAAISNTDYEGEIKNKGDKVIIRTKPTITIKDYKADGAWRSSALPRTSSNWSSTRASIST